MITKDSLELSIGSLGTDHQKFVHDFEASLERYGSALITDHGVDPSVIARSSNLFAEFCNEPESYKAQFHVPRPANGLGYARCDLGGQLGAAGDGELWQVGGPLAQGDAGFAAAAERFWPHRPDGFREAASRAFAEFDKAGNILLGAIARFLWLEEDWFADKAAGDDGTLQLINIGAPLPDAAGPPFGLAGNVDLVTMMFCTREVELEFRSRWEDDWNPVRLAEGAMLVVAGDMLQRITNDVLAPPVYRFSRRPSGGGQPAIQLVSFSLPFRSEVVIQTLAECGLGTPGDRYPHPIAAGEFRLQRLREGGSL